MRDTAVALTAAGIDNARFEARLLLAEASGLTIEQLVARGTDDVPANVVEMARSLTARRVRREPMAYILGEREFWGLPFKVSPAVLVPRPDSETLIEAVLSLMPDRARAWRILDLGLGSGCLLLTLLREYPQARGVGLEASAEALAVAQENANALGVADRAQLIEGDWRRTGWAEALLQALGGPFDLVVSNPPYIASAAVPKLMPEVSSFEPRLALDGGAEGFDAYQVIIAASPRLVTAGGFMAVEAGEGQATEITRIFAAAGLTPRPPWKDLGGIDRVVTASN
ncbi:MAG TPA: peptide chain release factor N(5)-glutamine methyltransferase [Reyranella sp.]|nr:peptide chain release factor N(5)-glutamine methyltransferase [Reyranella sp.]